MAPNTKSSSPPALPPAPPKSPAGTPPATPGHQPPKSRQFDPTKFSVSGFSREAAASPSSKKVDPNVALAKGKAPYALGLVLEEAGLVNKDMIRDMVSMGNESAQSLKRSQIQQGLVNESDILDAVASQVGMDKVNLRDVEVSPELLSVISPRFAKQNQVFPVSSTDEELVVAIGDPTNLRPLDDLHVMLGKRVTGVLAAEDELGRFIVKYYEGDEIGKIYTEFTKETDEATDSRLAKYATIDLDSEDRNQRAWVRFVDLVFKQAVHDGASDVHYEPSRTGLVVRLRVDGVLREMPQPPPHWQNGIISRIKVMSGMDLAEKRVPQDGRIKLTLPDRSLDLRVSCLPSIFGETIVMRILDQSDVIMGLEDVGFLPDTVALFRRLIKAPNGVILMTGPTGSGKTTTLNAALNTLNSPEEKIITVEDPVEYMMQGITQIQVNPEVELNFGMALRSMLRMSPDVIMVGEIRDVETAEIAIRAALTGHLVFSTLHTNDAPGAATRLIDMGVKPFLVASSVQAVIAQRLIRRICSNCKAQTRVPEEALVEMGVDPMEYASVPFYHGAGCERCGDSGYRGRTAIHEVFVMDPTLRKMVIRNEATMKLKREAINRGMRTLRMDGWEKVLLGQTTLEEVMRITQMD